MVNTKHKNFVVHGQIILAWRFSSEECRQGSSWRVDWIQDYSAKAVIAAEVAEIATGILDVLVEVHSPSQLRRIMAVRAGDFEYRYCSFYVVPVDKNMNRLKLRNYNLCIVTWLTDKRLQWDCSLHVTNNPAPWPLNSWIRTSLHPKLLCSGYARIQKIERPRCRVISDM